MKFTLFQFRHMLVKKDLLLYEEGKGNSPLPKQMAR